MSCTPSPQVGDGGGDGDGDGDGGGQTFPAHPSPIPKACRDQISRKGNPSLRLLTCSNCLPAVSA